MSDTMPVGRSRVRAARGVSRRLAGLALLLSALASLAARAAASEPVIEVFSRPGCPHCAEARTFFAELTAERSGLVIVEHDVTRDANALERLRDLSARAGITTPGVPAFLVGSTLLVGFDSQTTPARLRALLETAGRGKSVADACALEPSRCAALRPEASPGSVELPLLGRLDVERLGLPLFTVAVGLVDGFNPCATWVLLFLLALLVRLKNRARMALIAGTFVVVSGVVYFAFMAAWVSFFLVIGVSQPLRLLLAAFALGIGGLNVKDFFAHARGPSLAIPESAKPGLYRRARAILRAENLAGAMAGIVVLAFLVNLVELLCTAGLPALYTAILTQLGLPRASYYGYLALYIAAYMLDDAILVTVGVATLGQRKLQERGGRWLKLLSGLIILALGALLLLRPSWLGF
jgi:glutaredoxin